MPKVKSQWEFGELFAQPVLRRVLSVSELTGTVKRLLEQQIGRVWVTGEVTNLRVQSSGHVYFAIKDATAQLSCVLFRAEARAFNRDLLKDGIGVNVQGDLTVYEARGQYQLIVTAVELQGVGALQVAFEKLKQRLLAQGLFAQERKRPLPRFPQRLGIVTSRSGAAIRDVLQCIRRRYPGLEIVLASCRVQGQGAGEELACAVQLLNQWNDSSGAHPERRLDLILLTRGGGSLEDLWAFNEEPLARAVFESRLPVISAVGHEIDFTISDFVADFRAATPTAAAEIITEGYVASRPFILQAQERLRMLVHDQMAASRRDLNRLVQRLQRQHPLRWLHEQWQRLDDLSSSLQRCMRYGLRNRQAAALSVVQRLARVRPSQILAQRRERAELLRLELRKRAELQVQRLTQRLGSAQARLRLLSPLHVLERGYSITLDAGSGRIIQSARDARPGQVLRTRVRDGTLESVVKPSDSEDLSQNS